MRPAFFACITLVTAQTLGAQPSVFDSLYAAFAQAKTDSAKLEASFEIIQNLEDYQLDEQKKWVDTTAEIAARMKGHLMDYRRQLYLANWHRMSGDFKEGYELAIHCAQKFKEMGDDFLQSSALFEAGTALSEFNPTTAMEVLKEAAELGRKAGKETLRARCLVNMAYAMELAKLNQTDEYRRTLEESLEVMEGIGDLDGVLVGNFNLVEYYARKRQFGQARQRVAAMRAMLEKVEDEVYFIYPLVAEGNILMAEGSPEKALKNYEAGWKVVKDYGIVEGQLELFPVIIKAYAAVGDYKSAFLFSENYQTMRDSMVSLEKTRTVQHLQTRYETEKKEAQIAAQKADLARSRQEKWVLAGGLALLGGFSVLFWRQRRKTQAANIELAASNQEIALKNQKLDLLMRELHHRVKNNLQLVSSLLRLQSRKVGDGAASAAIQAGQLRVEAMSLIHQRLYREEGITWVNMQEFTEDLVEKIAYAFGQHLAEIDLQIQFQILELDVDKAMPMSLIINELLTNSFKYAFGGPARPGIKISLEQQGEKLIFQYADNGPGFPDMPIANSSFGSTLINSLCGQLGGQARQWSEGGARFEVVFEADSQPFGRHA
jgi:two-component sensor histidine kinase